MELPLFPPSVLFPGRPLPLRTFEERYKLMVRELLESRGEFGVILIREGQEVGSGAKPHNFGTLARIEECEELQGGRFALDARGTRRFKLVRMLSPRPYPYGQVEVIDDSTPENTPQLRHAVNGAHNLPLSSVSPVAHRPMGRGMTPNGLTVSILGPGSGREEPAA